MAPEAEITTMSEKGQVVIPKRIRRNLKIKPRTKFAVYVKNGMIVMKAFEVPDLEKELSEIFRMFDRKKLIISDKEIDAEVKAH